MTKAIDYLARALFKERYSREFDENDPDPMASVALGECAEFAVALVHALREMPPTGAMLSMALIAPSGKVRYGDQTTDEDFESLVRRAKPHGATADEIAREVFDSMLAGILHEGRPMAPLKEDENGVPLMPF